MSRYAAPLLFLACALCQAQQITTFAGGGFKTDNGIAATSALVAAAQGIASDAAGNVYFWDSTNILRKVDTNGVINTVAGNGNQVFYFAGNIGDGGPATSAAFGPPGLFAGVAVDASGIIYICDPSNKRIRKVDTAGIITTFSNVGFSQPSGIALDPAGNLYAADINLGRIYKLDKSGNGTVVAGGGVGGDGGPATSASLRSPYGIAFDKQGNLYISDSNMLVRKVDTSGIITTVAGTTIGFSGDGGPATKAQFFGIQGLAVDNAGNVYIADNGNYRVRKLDTSGIITTVAGNGQFGFSGDGGLAINATLKPNGLAFDPSGNLYISSGTVRKVAFGTAAPGLYPSASSLYFEGTVAHPIPATQVLAISTLGAPIGFKVSSTVQSGSNWLSASTTTGTTTQTMSISVANGPSTAGTYKGTLTFTPTTPGYSPLNVPVTFVINATPPPTPVITAVANGASSVPGYTANSIWTIYGTNLSSVTDGWANSIVGGELPASLDGVTVAFGGYPAYLIYISPTQINLLTPNSGLGGPLAVVNNNGASSAAFPIQGSALPYSPAFFLWPNSQVVATHTDYTYAVAPGTFSGLPTVAAKPGEVIVLWGTGFGATTPATQVGAVTPSDKVYATSVLPTVTINGVSAPVVAAALAPGAAGEYQLAIQVPSSLANGTYPIVASVGIVDAVSSPNTVMLTVHN